MKPEATEPDGQFDSVLYTEAEAHLCTGFISNVFKSEFAAIVGALIKSATPRNIILGAYITKVTEVRDVTDLNDLTGVNGQRVLYFCSPSSSPSNLPASISTSTRFYVDTFSLQSYYKTQILINVGTAVSVFVRCKISDTWSAWKEL